MAGPYRRVELMFQKILQKQDTLSAQISAISHDLKVPRGTVYLSVGLQTTINALKAFTGPASAEQISALTGRARAVESMHLNELFRMGLAKKEKRSRTAFFHLKEEFFDEG